MAVDKSGNITTQNLVPAGVATAGSAVSLPLNNIEAAAMAIQVTGVYTGALTVQTSLDGVNWVSLGGASTIVNLNTGAATATIASAATGIFIVNIANLAGVRVTGLAAVTGTATVTMVAGLSPALISLVAALPTGTNSIGTVQIGNTANTTPILANPGNPTNFTLLAAATTNATSLKASAGNVHGISITNYTAAAKFVKLYDKASAPTVGTDTPVDNFEVAANSSRFLEFGTLGLRFATGIALALTGLQPIADVTALAAGDVSVHIAYV